MMGVAFLGYLNSQTWFIDEYDMISALPIVASGKDCQGWKILRLGKVN
jgi:hypothetical protein